MTATRRWTNIRPYQRQTVYESGPWTIERWETARQVVWILKLHGERIGTFPYLARAKREVEIRESQCPA